MTMCTQVVPDHPTLSMVFYECRVFYRLIITFVRYCYGWNCVPGIHVESCPLSTSDYDCILDELIKVEEGHQGGP